MSYLFALAQVIILLNNCKQNYVTVTLGWHDSSYDYVPSISQPKHMLWILKNVAMRRFF